MQRVPLASHSVCFAPLVNMQHQAATRVACLPSRTRAGIAEQARIPKHRELCTVTFARQGRLEKDNHIAAFATQANLSMRSEKIVRTALQGVLLLRVLPVAPIA